MLQEEILDSPPGRSVKMVDSHKLTASEMTSKVYPVEHEFSKDQSLSSSYVVLTKGADDEYNNDAKTVSTDAESFSQSYSQQERQQDGQQRSNPVPYNELDFTFLREGELFDREEQQQRLLEAFHRQMVTTDNNNNIDTSVYDNRTETTETTSTDNRSQSLKRRSSRFSSCSLRPRCSKEFVIVSGLSGTGKTILVEETLRSTVEERGGYFLCGKLDQLNKDTSSPQRPYAPFVMAFENLVDSVLPFQDVTQDIIEGVSAKMTSRDVDLIVETFPSLAKLFGDSEASKNKRTGADNQLQLARVVRIFLETICDPQKRPIVLLIDDLQWADQGTLVLMDALLSESEDDRTSSTNGLLLVGTCRHNEVTVEDDLAMFLRTLEDEENVVICQIEVSNLSRPVCGELFARVLGIPSENYTQELASSLDPLVDIAYEQTKGNAFFLLQFIRSLHDEGYLQVQTQAVQSQESARDRSSSKKFQLDDDTYLTSDTSMDTDNQSQQHEALHKTAQKEEKQQQQPTNWLWSEEAIRRSKLHDAGSVKQDAVSILTHQMKKLPQQVQETLLVASCLGAVFDKQVLQMAMPPTSKDTSLYSSEELSNSLELLIEKNFLRSNSGRGYFRFCHDKIQQAAIALVDDKERALFCTNIGRRVLEHTGNGRGEIIFLIVNFFSHGVSAGIITDRSERMLVAKLAMEAGETAASMSDFTTAATYYNLGISCLQSNYVGIRDGYWKDEYDFSLAIFSAAADIEKCVANFERMDVLIKEILRNARQFYDKMSAYSTMIQALGIRERLLEAIAQGFSLLEVVGERFHTKDLKIFLLFDLIKTKRMLKNFDGDLERCPVMTNKDKLAAMEILNLIFPYCSMLKHPKAPHAIFRMVQLTVKYGITENSATGFAGYGMGLCGLGDFMNGNRYGKFALRLLDHFQAKHLICRVHCLYYGFISNWNRPLAMNVGPCMDAHNTGLSTGDIEFSGACASVYATNSFHAGLPLASIDTEVTKLQELLILFRQKAGQSVISPILQHVYNLREGGKVCKIPWILTGNACVEEILMAEAKASNNAMCLSQFNFRKLWMAYVFNNYEYALAMADESAITIKSSMSSFFVYSHYFFEGMTCMALARDLGQKKFERRAKRCLKRMKKFNNYCKRNCLNKFLMLEAEFLVMKGDLLGGLELFEKSASVSQEEGFMHEKAIAYERAGLAVLHASDDPNDKISLATANDYFTKSIATYQDWGAITKVDQMIANGYS